MHCLLGRCTIGMLARKEFYGEALQYTCIHKDVGMRNGEGMIVLTLYGVCISLILQI